MTTLSYETLIYTKKQNYAEIRFNRPHRLNAVIEQFYTELLSALAQAEADGDVRAILLTGEGRAFCVGADMKEHGAGERTQYQRREYLQLGNDVCEAIFRATKPVVAAINGYALGAGAEMACSCDFVIMAESAKIGFPEVSIGTCVGGGVTQFLTRLVGLAKARELIFLGTKIDGNEALAIGLVTRAVPADDLQQQAEAFIAELASKAPISMRFVKKLLNNASHTDLDAQLQQELDGVFTCTTTKDWQEGVDAFAEKRSPAFKGH
ncbi:enoyl-CoA hydratase-related protein [Amphritea sp. 2_MG-2023]|uniref:enoyl-CoA hydratase/isomerase family protein n=1 Tax=Amphritea TaxID=515417 RepID=UPI001C0693FF|nr:MULTISPECIES: enoyl-CoA hydratase-related protein [Amphritea]MBU2964122.1 enoyl-CoA hydratase/isomerase family protein [Amphritea atlantica]MDO6418522.1 enoyl-CoA hydratase-related protein [Amphritea sp. 2_MG-2023]